MNATNPGRPFRLLRYFSVAALLSIGIATLGLSYMYRQLAVADLVRMGEAHNVSQARILATAIAPDFGPFLLSAADLDGDALRAHPETRRLHGMLVERVRGTTILKLKIYALNGRTIYSSEEKQIGEDKSRNAGFLAAREGKAASELTHRNRFSAFEQVVEKRGVLASYVPMRDAAGAVGGGVRGLRRHHRSDRAARPGAGPGHLGSGGCAAGSLRRAVHHRAACRPHHQGAARGAPCP